MELTSQMLIKYYLFSFLVIQNMKMKSYAFMRFSTIGKFKAFGFQKPCVIFCSRPWCLYVIKYWEGVIFIIKIIILYQYWYFCSILATLLTVQFTSHLDFQIRHCASIASNSWDSICSKHIFLQHLYNMS